LKKLTTPDFIKRCIIIHGNKYCYDNCHYINKRSKVNIICKEHGEFSQIAEVHENGFGCPKCGRKYMNTKYFKEKAKIIHGNKYDYDLVEYVKNNQKIKIICPEHGNFYQTPNAHLIGQGCPICNKQKRVTMKEFLVRAMHKHGNKYDYSIINYINVNTKIDIKCPIHGIFKQTPHLHLNGNGCSKCSKKYMDSEYFKEKARIIHGNKYGYELVKYFKNNEKIKIICPEHGIFEQTPNSHLHGNGCPKCAGKYMDSEYFKEKARIIHSNKYNYELVEYVKNNQKIKIICPEHGIFEQTPNSHLTGKGCLKCAGFNKTTKEFIEKANVIHNNKYDYSRTVYVNAKTKIKIICPKHGIFEQTPNSHLGGGGCLVCVGKYLDKELFIKKANKIHINKYNYSKVVFINSKSKVIINCPVHGDFKQTPNGHLRKQGCPLCNTSKGEVEIILFLNNYNIKYIRQYYFNECKNLYKLYFDFYLPEYNILLEFDGEQHFRSVDYFGGNDAFTKTQTRDKIKTNFAKENNIKLLRIKYNEKIFDILKKTLLPIINNYKISCNLQI